MNDRELEKIRKYEVSKYWISTVMKITFIVGVIVTVMFFAKSIPAYINPRDKYQYLTDSIAKGIVILFGLGWGLFVIKLILCAICDHIIELCYLNMKSKTPSQQNGTDVEYL